MTKEVSLHTTLDIDQRIPRPAHRFSRRKAVIGGVLAGLWIITGAGTIADCHQEQKKNHAKESNK